MSPVNVKIPVGLVRTLNVIGVYSDGSRSSLNAFCNFISKDPKVVEISSIFGTSDEKGKVTAKSAGKADIDIFCYGKSISTSIEVTDDKLIELFVSPSQSDVLISNPQIAGINNLRFNADGKFDSGEIYNLSFQSQWFSSDETKCKIFNSFGLKGLVQLLSTGTCEIWAEFDGIKSKAAKVNIR